MTSRADAVLCQLQRAAHEQHGTQPARFAQYRDTIEMLIDRIIAERLPVDPTMDVEDVRRYLRDHARAADQNVPSPYEEPFAYHELSDALSAIERASQRLKLKNVPRPTIGTLATRELNATTMRLRGTGEHIIAVRPGLMVFLTGISRLIIRATALRETENGWNFGTPWMDDVLSFTSRIGPLLERFHDILIGFLYEDGPSPSPSSFREEPYRTLATLISRSMNRFVVAHEYGHVLWDHGVRVASPSSDSEAQPRSADVERVALSYTEELSADALALQLMLIAMRDEGVTAAVSFVGAESFLTALDILQQAVIVATTGAQRDMMSETHPPSSARRDILREYLREMLKESDEAIATLKISHAYSTLLYAMWRGTKPTLEKLHAEGKSLASHWLH